MRLYLDAAPVIYLIEENEDYVGIVDQILEKSDVELIASDLTRLECRIKPIQENNQELLKDYDEFFSDVVSKIVPLSRDVIDRATEIRSEHGFKTPDSIHLAAAVVSNCDQFLTNDLRLKKFTDIKIRSVVS
tara:strand:- start:88 stop:483 length:396 start_codon:yes stop_codon:yes gene_type:complete